MKLSISNIAWAPGDTASVYSYMHKYGFTGLEIAPTAVFPEQPYADLERAKSWAERLKRDHGFSVSSMQSIWYGRTEQLFGTEQERAALLEYTFRAIDFAEAVGCPNLVFGCPRSRCTHSPEDIQTGIGFFRELGSYASAHGAVVAMEANPPIYNTNYINTTAEAIRLIRDVDSPGFLLNLDVGTMLCNEESAELLRENVSLIHHVHISEPGLKPIPRRPLHKELAGLLKETGYDGFVSVEMGKGCPTGELGEIMAYVREVFS